MADEKLKKRIERCLGILTKILSQKGLNRKILAQEYGCAVRTIAADIALLRDIGFKIRYEQSEYTLSTADLNIPPLPLQENQILALFIASQLMVLTPLEQKANEALQQMQAVLSEEAITFLRNLSDRVYIAPGGDLGDTRILFEVYRAVSECQSLEIRYQALSTQQEETHLLDPLGIYIKDRARSYLAGHTYETPRLYRRFKLCRIIELKFRGIHSSAIPRTIPSERICNRAFGTANESMKSWSAFIPTSPNWSENANPPKILKTCPAGICKYENAFETWMKPFTRCCVMVKAPRCWSRRNFGRWLSKSWRRGGRTTRIECEKG